MTASQNYKIEEKIHNFSPIVLPYLTEQHLPMLNIDEDDADESIGQFIIDTLISSPQMPVLEKKQRKGGIKDVFPLKLYKMLQNLEFENEYQDVIHWNEEGDSFTIRNTKEFSSALLPKYFRTGQFTSFTRQLRGYGFIQKKPWESHKWIRSYTHFLFRRDHPENIEKIKRRNSMDFNRKNVFSKQGGTNLLEGMKNQESEAILQSSFSNTGFNRKNIFSKQGEKRLLVEKKNQESDSFDSVLQLSLKLRDESNFSLSGWNAEDESLSSLSIEKDSSNRTISLGSLLDLM